METELKRDQISLWTEVGQESTQLLLEGDVVVPDSKPDVEQIIYTAGAVRWDNPTASEGKVLAERQFRHKNIIPYEKKQLACSSDGKQSAH